MEGSRPFLTAGWRNLVMLSWDIDPEILAPRLPAGTELDVWQGKVLVTIVGLHFHDTRLLGIPIPFHRRFPDVNLRFYVRRREDHGWKRGVVFVKEVVPHPAIALLARWAYGESFVSTSMQSSAQLPTAGEAGLMSYSWKVKGTWNALVAAPHGRPALPAEGSEHAFVVERYWGYAARRHGEPLEYRVEHPPWLLWPVAAAHLECDVEAMYGRAFVEPLGTAPSSALVAEGSRVAVYPGRSSAG